MSEPSALYQLVEERLRAKRQPVTDPAEWIRVRRTADPPLAYGKIARELGKLLDLDITHEWVRRVHNQAEAERAAHTTESTTEQQ